MPSHNKKMVKEILVILLLLLSGCGRYRNTACELKDQEKEIYINIEAINDDINKIHIVEALYIPYKYLLNKDKLSEIDKQIGDDYQLIDNKIVFEYDVDIKEPYSYRQTIDKLDKEYFYCEWYVAS